MKKLILFLIVSFAVAAPQSAAFAQLTPPKKQGIPIDDGKYHPQPDIPTPTSLTATVEASYDAEFSLLEVVFNREVGKVTISLTDNTTGRTLIAYTCDSAIEPQVLLNLALGTGYYTLRIEGSDYEGYGDFEL